MSENKPDNNRPVDPVSRLRSALDRIAFALEHRREEAQQPSVPEAVVEGPQPDVQAAIASLDALMVDVKNILGELAPAQPQEEPVEISADFASHEQSGGVSDPAPEAHNQDDGWRHVSDHDASQHGEGY